MWHCVSSVSLSVSAITDWGCRGCTGGRLWGCPCRGHLQQKTVWQYPPLSAISPPRPRTDWSCRLGRAGPCWVQLGLDTAPRLGMIIHRYITVCRQRGPDKWSDCREKCLYPRHHHKVPILVVFLSRRAVWSVSLHLRQLASDWCPHFSGNLANRHKLETLERQRPRPAKTQWGLSLGLKMEQRLSLGVATWPG